MHPNYIQIPFALAEEARVFLAWLATDESSLTDSQKTHIREFVESHDQNVLSYIAQKYGQGMAQQAVRISESIEENFYASLNAAIDAAQGDLFDRLEKEIFNGDNG